MYAVQSKSVDLYGVFGVERTASPAPRRAPEASVPFAASSFGRGLNWPAMATIVGLHLAVVFVLAVFDVVPRHHHRHKSLTMVDLKPLPEVHTPPPPAARQDLPKSAPIELPPVITAPPAVVTVAAPPAISAPPPAPPVAIVAAPAPQAAVAVPVSAPSAEVGDFGNESPKYPQMSLRLREQGVVRLRVVIDSAGLVRDISVAQGSGFSRLDRAALDGIRKWRFHPGMANGRPLDGAIGFLNYVFALRG